MNILVVEDEPNVRKLIQVNLEREGLTVFTCDDGEQAIALFESGTFSLVVLDWMLRGRMTGIDVCKRLTGRVPILMVTARSDTTEIVIGLEVGADDYLTKPFEVPVLIARVRALLRRALPQKSEGGDEVHELGQLSIHVGRVEVRCHGAEVKLTASEFKLLLALARKKGSVLSRDSLLKQIQEQGVNVADRVIDTHVYSLRTKLGACGDVIETVRGIGYRVKG